MTAGEAAVGAPDPHWDPIPLREIEERGSD